MKVFIVVERVSQYESGVAILGVFSTKARAEQDIQDILQVRKSSYLEDVQEDKVRFPDETFPSWEEHLDEFPIDLFIREEEVV